MQRAERFLLYACQPRPEQQLQDTRSKLQQEGCLPAFPAIKGRHGLPAFTLTPPRLANETQWTCGSNTQPRWQWGLMVMAKDQRGGGGGVGCICVVTERSRTGSAECTWFGGRI